MTTNEQRAARLIDAEHIESIRDMRFPNPSKLARALDAAGPLAPELPAPGAVDEFGNASWFAGPEAAPGYVAIGEYAVLPPDEARYLARQILAAARYAEEEK